MNLPDLLCPWTVAPDEHGEAHPHHAGFKHIQRTGNCAVCGQPISKKWLATCRAMAKLAALPQEERQLLYVDGEPVWFGGAIYSGASWGFVRGNVNRASEFANVTVTEPDGRMHHIIRPVADLVAVL